MPRLKLLLSVIILGLTLWLAREPLLEAAGGFLVAKESPVKADVIVVLGGDSRGVRAGEGCELLKASYAPQLWISGNQNFFGLHESDAARDFVIARGCKAEQVAALKLPVDSTRDEAEMIGRRLREQGAKTCLLVTSNYHTRRAGRIFRRVNPDLEFRVVAAPNDDFRVQEWWRHRHSQRIFLNEWLKTIAYLVGI